MIKIILTSFLLVRIAWAIDIPEAYRIDWEPGVTVGSRSLKSMTTTNVIDITQPPYSAPTNGNDASDAFNQVVIDKFIYGWSDLVILANGHFVCSQSVQIANSSITLRSSTNDPTQNSIWLGGSLTLGRSASNGQGAKTGEVITNGLVKGSVSITLSNNPTFGVGEVVLIGGYLEESDMFQVIGLGQPYWEQKNTHYVTSIVGRVIGFTPPIPFTMSNGFVCRWSSTGTFTNCALENLTLTASNRFNGQKSTATILVKLENLVDSHMTNCTVMWGSNHMVLLASSTHVTCRRNTIRLASGSGSNHSGFLMGGTGCLIEDNILADGLQPGIEFNGASANAFMGNFFTNNLIDIDDHGPHPMMNLWEANHLGTYPVIENGGTFTNRYGGAYEEDGYFGSASHNILFRNIITSPYAPVYWKRWSSSNALVANVLGDIPSGWPYSYGAFSHDSNGLSGQILDKGRPNIGNNTYIGTNPPIAWNFPGSTTSIDLVTFYTNGQFVITNDHVDVTTITGYFANIPAVAGSLIFQDNVSTNLYHPRTGVIAYINTNRINSLSNINIYAEDLSTPRAITVSNGWRVFFISQLNGYGYQQLITTNRSTHYIAANWDRFNNTYSNDPSAYPASYLYDSVPNWWGTNRWPAAQPDNVQTVAGLPAQDRYNGLTSGGGGSTSTKKSAAGAGNSGTKKALIIRGPAKLK